MEITPNNLTYQDRHKLLIGCVVPRPIAWVSTLNSNGQLNLAPFSFFNAIGATPPALSIAFSYREDHPTHLKDTLRNILELREFVVNVVNEPNAQPMNVTATEYPDGDDEFTRAGLTTAPSKTIRAPRVAEAPISFECMLYTYVPVGEGPGSATLVVGLITHIFVRDELIDESYRVDVQKLQPIGRLAGSGYTYVHETFEMKRQPYKPE